MLFQHLFSINMDEWLSGTYMMESEEIGIRMEGEELCSLCDSIAKLPRA